MPGAIAVATALADTTPRTYMLHAGPFFVTKRPPQTGVLVGYGVPVDSIRVNEAGPGGVSTMTFDIDDPQAELNVKDAWEVRFEKVGRLFPEFRGWVQTYSSEPWATGRRWHVGAIGTEALLDWLKLAVDVTFPINSIAFADGVQALHAACQGVGANGLRAFQGSSFHGGTDDPIEATLLMLNNLGAVTVKAGTTLRNAIYALAAMVDPQGAAGTGLPGIRIVDVDFLFGLRVWLDAATLGSGTPGFDPADYSSLAFDNTHVAGFPYTESLKWDRDVSGVKRGVMVFGSGGVQVTVTDGTGIPGDFAVIRDDNITTVGQATAIGQAALMQTLGSSRGSFRFTDVSPETTLGAAVRAGSIVTLTDPTVGMSAEVSRISGIVKTYQDSGREDWTISFGALTPSAARLVRRWTRGALF